MKAFADWARIPEAIARLALEDYYPKNNVLPDRIEGLDLAMANAVSFKYIAAPLSKEQARSQIGRSSLCELKDACGATKRGRVSGPRARQYIRLHVGDLFIALSVRG